MDTQGQHRPIADAIPAKRPAAQCLDSATVHDPFPADPSRPAPAEDACAFLTAASRILHAATVSRHASDSAAIEWTAEQAVETALQALAALRTSDRQQQLDHLREAVHSARATVLSCTMAVYRGQQQATSARGYPP